MKKEEEQLIKELEEQLFQYTYGNKEIAPEQLETICKLLDVLKPQEAPETKIEDSFEAFQEMCKKRDEEEAKATKRRKATRYRKLFMGIAASLFLVLTVNIGSYATKQKSFFDIMSEGKNGIGFLVTGNQVEEETSEEELALEESSERHYSSWEEVDEKTKKDIIIPKDVPEGFELEDISVYELDTQKTVRVNYKDGSLEQYIALEITNFNSQVGTIKLFMEGNGQFVKKTKYENTEFQFYQLNEDTICYFLKNNKVYRISSNLTIEKLEKSLIKMFS